MSKNNELRMAAHEIIIKLMEDRDRDSLDLLHGHIEKAMREINFPNDE